MAKEEGKKQQREREILNLRKVVMRNKEEKMKHYKVVLKEPEPRERETITFHPVGDGRWVAE